MAVKEPTFDQERELCAADFSLPQVYAVDLYGVNGKVLNQDGARYYKALETETEREVQFMKILRESPEAVFYKVRHLRSKEVQTILKEERREARRDQRKAWWDSFMNGLIERTVIDIAALYDVEHPSTRNY